MRLPLTADAHAEAFAPPQRYSTSALRPGRAWSMPEEPRLCNGVCRVG
jgi:hypothetical protein